MSKTPPRPFLVATGGAVAELCQCWQPRLGELLAWLTLSSRAPGWFLATG